MRHAHLYRLSLALALAGLPWSPGSAQTAPDSAAGVGGRTAGAPAARSVLVPATRSPEGRLVLTAIETAAPVRIDGALDDELWTRAPAVGGFVQAEPQEGQAATEATEVQVGYDGDTLYIGAYCHDSGADQVVVNDIRKDFKTGDQDSFEVVIDTFLDRRNGFMFMTNPAGARSDQQMANEGKEVNASWDGVWFVKTRRVDDGWTVEMAIPFKSLRFQPGKTARWGVNFSRRIRRKNELDYWAPVARAYTLSRVSVAGDLVGLPDRSPGRNLRVKPFVLASAIRNVGESSFKGDPDIGLDLKYGVTPALTLDATVRPDFAQAEADEQQVNLTQFSQFFPEKREFFLENSGIFYVGDAARNNRVNPTPTPDEDLLLFFSRRIGLTGAGEPIPINAGGRLTGKLGGLSLGLLNIQTSGRGAAPANNFTVARVRRNLGRASDIGAIFQNRQATDRGGDYNRLVGVDWNVRFLGNLDWSSYAVRTFTPGRHGGQEAWRTSFNWEGNYFHGKGGVLEVGENFRSDLSYYRRTNTRKWFLDTGIRPRFKSLVRYGIREMHPHVVWNYYTDLDGRPTGKTLHSGYTFFMNSGAYGELSVNPESQRLTRPLILAPGTPAIQPGFYTWVPWQLRLNSDPSRAVSVATTYIWKGLWSGDQKTLNATLTVSPSYRFRVSLGVQRTDAHLERPMTDFTTSVWTMRANYSFTTNMFVDSLAQWLTDRDQFNANVRFNLIHRPLSDLYVVYNEQRFTTADAPAAGRGVIVKFTQMMAF